MKRFTKSIRENELFDMFLQIFNSISDKHNLNTSQYDKVEKTFLLYLISDRKHIIDYDEFSYTFDRISELLILYSWNPRYFNYEEIIETIETLLTEYFYW